MQQTQLHLNATDDVEPDRQNKTPAASSDRGLLN
jgi:hypothetical protein